MSAIWTLVKLALTIKHASDLIDHAGELIDEL